MAGDVKFEWTFVVSPLDGPGDERIDSLYDKVDAFVASEGGLTLATIATAAWSAVQSARSAISALFSSGFEVERTYPDMVTRSEIAERANVSRQAVTLWVTGKRQAAFPVPVSLAGSGIWLWSDVSRWLVENLRDFSTDGVGYPSLRDHLQVDYELSRSRQSVAAYTVTNLAAVEVSSSPTLFGMNLPPHKGFGLPAVKQSFSETVFLYTESDKIIHLHDWVERRERNPEIEQLEELLRD